MGKAEKQVTMNEYEKIRNARIAENKIRLQESGILNIAQSFSRLVEASNNDQRKGKRNSKNKSEDDMNYIPDFADDRDEQDHLLNGDMSKKVTQHSGGRHQVRYIPPRSMNRYSNVTKEGMKVNNPDQCQKIRQDPRIGLQMGEERANTSRGAEGEIMNRKSNANKMTMAELILQKNKFHRPKEGVSNHRDRTLSDLTNLTLNGKDSTRTENVTANNQLVQRNVTHYSQGNRSHLDKRVQYDKDPTFLDKDMDVESDNEIERSFDCDTESLIGSTDKEEELSPEHELHLINDEAEQADTDNRDLQLDAIMKEKTRGPTMLHHVHMRSFEKRKAIILNEFGQPIGPITEEDDTVSEFSRFLGTIARDYSYAPLIFPSWRHVPNKEKMWEYVLMKYIVPDEGKDWVIKTIGAAWRSHKCRFKKKHYYAFADDKSRWKNRSKTVPDNDFLKLLGTWTKKSEKIRCSRNRDRRSRQKNMHTVGPKSFAIIREQMKNEHPNKEPPSLAELFEHTRKRTEGKAYKDSYDDTAKKIEDMKAYKSIADETDSSDAYLCVMGKESDGHRRLYGRGVCNKKLKQVHGTPTSYVVPEQIMESFKTTLFEDMKKDMESELGKLQDMRKGMEEEHSKKMLDLEKMQKDLENEREIMSEQVLQKILKKLPTDVARQYLM